jgi:hypothetical protein
MALGREHAAGRGAILMAVNVNFSEGQGDLPPDAYAPGDDPRASAVRATVEAAARNAAAASTDGSDWWDKLGNSNGEDWQNQVTDALARGLITEEQARALWDGYIQLLSVYEQEEYSLGIDLGVALSPIAQMLGTNPTAAVGQLNVLISQVENLADRAQAKLEFSSREAHREWQRGFDVSREDRLARGQEAEIAQWDIRNRFSQAELEAENRRAELGALETAARTRADLAASALSARSSLSGALFGRAGGFPYPGAAGPSPSASGLHSLGEQFGAVVTPPYQFTGGPVVVPDVTSTIEFQRALQRADELANRQLHTPVVVPIGPGGVDPGVE